MCIRKIYVCVTHTTDTQDCKGYLDTKYVCFTTRESNTSTVIFVYSHKHATAVVVLL